MFRRNDFEPPLTGLSTATSNPGITVEANPSAQTALIPTDPDVLLTRDAAAAALTARGFPTSPATLASLVTRGNGPEYQKYGARPLYRWGSLLDWARSKLGPVQGSTSEFDYSQQYKGNPGVRQ
jgi:hypothetical protein